MKLSLRRMPQILKGSFIERARRRTGRPSQAKATGCGDLKRDKIWAQIHQGVFDS
jgi:hypothetical protein